MVRFYKVALRLFYKPFVVSYLRKDRIYKWDGLKLNVSKGVFHPRFFYSSKFLSSFIKTLELRNKSFLEIGCGSGLVSLVAARQGASVTAIDISSKAVQDTNKNMDNNNLLAHVLISDLFFNVEQQKFDMIVVNPPYYPSIASSEADYAWKCGPEFEYFERLFKEVGDYLNQDSRFIMVLSDECELDRIMRIAKNNNMSFTQLDKKRIQLEWNYIYQIDLETNK